MKLGARIRKRREQLGLSPIQAAYKANFSEAYWRQFEGGQRKPQKIDTLMRIADALDWTVAELLNQGDDNAATVDNPINCTCITV